MEPLKIIKNTKSVDELRRAIIDKHPAFSLESLKKIIILGASDEGRRFAAYCKNADIEIVSIIDDNPDLVMQRIEGTEIKTFMSLDGESKDIPVIIASHRVLGAYNRLKDMGFNNVAPLAVVEVAFPGSFEPHMFYQNWFEDLVDNVKEYEALRAKLADDKSRLLLDALLHFRLDLNPKHIEPEIEFDLYGSDLIADTAEDQVYVDAGAFDGDSCRLFIERVGGKFDTIYAFEPDPDTFKKLESNFAGEDRLHPINAGLFDEEKVLRFMNDGSRGSTLVESTDGNTVEIDVIDLDTVLDGNRVTLIKMNIEGAELPALDGAKQSIRKWRPKLAISAYHKAGDLWAVANAIIAIDDGYDIYLRQHDGGVIESVIYGIPT